MDLSWSSIIFNFGSILGIGFQEPDPWAPLGTFRVCTQALRTAAQIQILY